MVPRADLGLLEAAEGEGWGKSRHGFLLLSSLPPCPSLPCISLLRVDAAAWNLSPEMVGLSPLTS